tara:strand:+ start:180 stop:782 length:603 start_codon:yes stop_codon:yes gene_type:complete
MSFLESIFNLFIYLNSELGILIFALIYISSVILILPASWLSLLAGFLYGKYLGSFIVFISAFAGATISFFISKEFIYQKIQKVISQFPIFAELEKIIDKGGLKLIIMTRLSPLFPFSLLNYFYGINKTSYKNFAISLFCILPGTYFYCSLGNLANDFNDIKNLKGNNNLFITIISIVSSALVIFLLARYAKEVIDESNNN